MEQDYSRITPYMRVDLSSEKEVKIRTVDDTVHIDINGNSICLYANNPEIYDRLIDALTQNEFNQQGEEPLVPRNSITVDLKIEEASDDKIPIISLTAGSIDINTGDGTLILACGSEELREQIVNALKEARDAISRWGWH